MECPACGQEMQNGWLILTMPDFFTRLRWSPEKVAWGPKPLPRDTHILIGFGFGARPREAMRCEHCTTVVVPPE